MRRQVQCAARLLGLALLVAQSGHAKDNSKPIVDVRFDGPYHQFESSRGDEWAPTWGRDDVLYTGNDDGHSFGGIPTNVITFGKLEGDDPYKMKGTTINGMEEYREPPIVGPENAAWKTVNTWRLGEVLYRFSPCGQDSNHSPYSCLQASRDKGKTWSAIGEAPPFRGTKFSAPSFIAFGRLFLDLMGDEAHEYAYASAYAGFSEGNDNYVVGRVRKTSLQNGEPGEWSFRDKNYVWQNNPNEAFPQRNDWWIGPDNANWKTTNTYSVDGILYMFVTRCTYPYQSTDPKRRHVWFNSSIIKSTDNGLTWTRPAEQNFKAPMFPGRRFGSPYFVWYGKDGAGTADNADQYIYAISNNGFFENGDDYVLGRVPRTKLANLKASDWSFYKGGDGMQDTSWTANLDDSRPFLSNPGRSSMTGMTYIEALDRYVMIPWHYNQNNFADGIKYKDLSTVLEFFEAPNPWGPWTKVKTLETGRLGWFVPIVGQRFQTAGGSGAVKVFVYAPGFDTQPTGGLDMQLYKLNYMPITLSTKPLKHKDPHFVGARASGITASN